MAVPDFNFQKTSFYHRKSSKEKYSSRLATIILLGGTILISGLLWFKHSWPKIEEQIIKTETYEVVKIKEEALTADIGFQPNLESLDGLINSITLLINKLQGTYGIYYFNLDNNQSFGINENIVYTAASVIKIPIIVNFYQQVETGQFKETDIYTLKKADLLDYGTGVLRYQKPGSTYTLVDLVVLSGKKSDNTAAYVLEKLIGRKTIQDKLNNIGMINTSIAKNTTTPKEMGDYLVKLNRLELVNEINREKILSAITDTDFEERIPAGVPDMIRVAHKIGNEIQTYNDCGIIFGPQPYILCILSQGVSENEALEVIPKISRLMWEYLN